MPVAARFAGVALHVHHNEDEAMYVQIHMQQQVVLARKYGIEFVL